MFILGEEKNRGRWKKGKVIRIVRGVDGVVRGVILLRKGVVIGEVNIVCVFFGD